MIFKKLFCKHKNKLLVQLDYTYFGREHMNYICTDCGKRF